MTSNLPATCTSMPEWLAAAVRKLDASVAWQLSELNVAREEKVRAKKALEEESAAALRPPSDLIALQQERTRLFETQNSAAEGKPDTAPQRRQLEALKADHERLLGSLRTVEAQIAALQQEINEITAILDELQRAHSRVVKKIANRNILIRLIKAVFGDAEAAQRQQFEQKIATTGRRRCDLDDAFKRAVQKKEDLEKERQSLAVQLESVHKQIQSIEDKEAAAEKKRGDISRRVHKAEELERSRIERTLDDLRRRRDTLATQAGEREAAISAQFAQRWTDALRQIDELCHRIRDRQPRLDELQAERLTVDWRVPDALAFGRARISWKSWRGYIPQLIPFPFKRALWLPAQKTGQEAVLQALLLRLLTALPCSGLRLVACDPRQLGKSLRVFLPLLGATGPFVDGKMLTRADEIEKALQRETAYIEDLLQVRFGGYSQTWASYNAAHRDTPIPYKVLLIFHAPEQLTDKSLHYLGRLVEHGPRCGLLPVLAMSSEGGNHRMYDQFLKDGSQFWEPLDHVRVAVQQEDVRHLAMQEHPEPWPSNEQLAHILERLNQLYATESQRTHPIGELWNTTPLWEGRTARGIAAPIGWLDDGHVAQFEIGGVTTEHHALLAGRSGSGKSNLLHVLIHSLCHRYPPDQLRIFLLDYKQGTELSVYARPPLPQAALVATESDPEYGVTVLEHLSEEIERRAQAFKKYSVTDVAEYEKGSGESLHRILVIIDEFQMLFDEGPQIADRAEKLLNKLLRQGRAYGVHVLLATQTLKGIQSVSMGQLTSQIGLRICLACGEEDSAAILGSTNWEGAKLRSPPEAILNNANGAKSANQRFRVPLADHENCAAHRSDIIATAEAKGFHGTPKVFDGAHLPDLPPAGEFATRVGSSDGVTLLLGRRLSFEEQFLSCPLVRRPGANLLCVGPDASIRNGLIRAILLSLSAQPRLSDFLYFGARDEECLTDVALAAMLPSGTRHAVQPMDWGGDLDQIPALENGRQGVLLVDGLDLAKVFHGGGLTLKPRPSPGRSPAEAFRAWLDEGPRKGWWTIAMGDNWKRIVASCRETLPYFQLRVGFCLSEDDAAALTLGSIGKLKGLDQPNRAVLADQHRNELLWFRPFRPAEPGDSHG